MITGRFTVVQISMNPADARRTSDNVLRLGQDNIIKINDLFGRKDGSDFAKVTWQLDMISIEFSVGTVKAQSMIWIE